MKNKILLNSEEFFEASKKGDVKKVVSLLEAGINPNLTGKGCRIALHYASENGHLEIVKSLLEKGADVNAQDNQGRTALHEASYKGHLKVVKLLLTKGYSYGLSLEVYKTGVGFSLLKQKQESEQNKPKFSDRISIDVNIQDENSGETPLHIACREGHLKIVQLLLEKEADINVESWTETPLHIACREGHLKIMKLLLEKGADIDVKDWENETPLGIAKKKSNKELIELFENK